MELSYGNIDAEEHNPDFKSLVQDFVKDYLHNAEVYVREKQEELSRFQEQQLAAMQYNATAQPVSFYAGNSYRKK
jgi:hypothetical protein